MSRSAGVAAGVAALLTVGGCTGDAAPTLAELRVTELSGQGGPGLAGRCPDLEVDGVAGATCGSGDSRSDWVGTLASGDYAVVLLCDGSISYRLEAVEPEEAFAPVSVTCEDTADPVVSRRISVPAAGVGRTSDKAVGDGDYMVMLVRVPAEA